ncbi:MAG: HzsA-related protein [Planctomycetota bacterium]
MYSLQMQTVCATTPEFGDMRISFSGRQALASQSSAGFSLHYLDKSAPQLAVMGSDEILISSLDGREKVSVVIPIHKINESFTISAQATKVTGPDTEVSLKLGNQHKQSKILRDQIVKLELPVKAGKRSAEAIFSTTFSSGKTTIRWDSFRLRTKTASIDIPLIADTADKNMCPPRMLQSFHPAIEEALIDWDWKMQDGINTERFPSTYPEAIKKNLDTGSELIQHLKSAGLSMGENEKLWRQLKNDCNKLDSTNTTEEKWYDLWKRVHHLRRCIVLNNPLAQFGPLAFVKHIPGVSSLQQMQYQGRYARPGGGVFILEEPGKSFRCRPLTNQKLPAGSYQHLDVSYDGKSIIFAFCPMRKPPRNPVRGNPNAYFNLYEIKTDGSGLHKLTKGSYDDFAPRYMPDGKIVFVSTRRGGYSRCGPDFAPSHTLAILNDKGTKPAILSFHEINEFDPAILNDGRIIYSRWDYVDRNAAFYTHLWTTRTDGTMVSIYYGNNTFNPMCTFEPRAIPGSNLVMATAGAHHAMTAGSIVLVDVRRGVDGPEPLVRLTPDALFPESEFYPDEEYDEEDKYEYEEEERPHEEELEEEWNEHENQMGDWPESTKRWPGHCYRSAYPLSEDFFLAAYSFEPLTFQEFNANISNMFGIYLIDRFGNKELIYRDLNHSSIWPMPICPRPGMPYVSSQSHTTKDKTGCFIIQNIYKANPPLPANTRITDLRIIQVFPRTSPYELHPLIGIPTAACGRQVLGTVPVEPDGSAYFQVPACVPLAFQALDENGRAVQMMRSITYLQRPFPASLLSLNPARMDQIR